MNILNSLIFTCVISLIVGLCTYLFQYCSTISPCNIEFDIRKKQELGIMDTYNEIFDRIFIIAMLVIMAFVIICMVVENQIFMSFVVIIELLYFVLNTISMFIMFIRSKLYWNLQECKKIKVQE